MGKYEERVKRTKWLEEARFGMFIHWGLYSIPARNEWCRSKEMYTDEEYYKYFEEFNPKFCDMKEWAKLAKDSGMKYAVLTTKHHDGFCLFDSKYTDFCSTKTKAKRDFVKEFVDAFRAEGIKIGLYYSLNDWNHPKYPCFGDVNHPRRFDESTKNEGRDLNIYIEYMHNQLKELLTNYGKVDLLWFDGSYEEMVGKAWKDFETEKLIRSIQPDIVINDRLSLNITTSPIDETTGDYYTPECIIPVNLVKDFEGRPLLWEECVSINGSWCYNASYTHYRPYTDLIRYLVECVSKGGNLLLNVGPDANGRIPDEYGEAFRKIGEWLKFNGDSIYGCGASQFSKPDWGRLTQNGNKLYAHVMYKTIGRKVICGLKDKVEKARILSDGSEIKIDEPWNAKYAQGNDNLFMEVPDVDKDVVVELTLK